MLLRCLEVQGNPERYSFDAAYVRRLTEGDPVTQRHFVAYFGDLLRAKLRNRLRSPALIDEAKQETFLRVLVTLRERGIDHPERLGAFVNSVCNNVVFETYRAEARTAPMPEDFNPVDSTAGTEAELVSAQRRHLVRKLLEELPRKERDLLTQVFLEEQDKDEICRRMGVDRDYLRVLLHRAKTRFCHLLGDKASAFRAGA